MKRQEHDSVLDDKKKIQGLPSDKKSSLEKARAGKKAQTDCDSALDGPACIDGVDEPNRDH